MGQATPSDKTWCPPLETPGPQQRSSPPHWRVVAGTARGCVGAQVWWVPGGLGSVRAAKNKQLGGVQDRCTSSWAASLFPAPWGALAASGPAASGLQSRCWRRCCNYLLADVATTFTVTVASPVAVCCGSPSLLPSIAARLPCSYVAYVMERCTRQAPLTSTRFFLPRRHVTPPPAAR